MKSVVFIFIFKGNLKELQTFKVCVFLINILTIVIRPDDVTFTTYLKIHNTVNFDAKIMNKCLKLIKINFFEKKKFFSPLVGNPIGIEVLKLRYP